MYHRYEPANTLENDQLKEIKTGTDHWLQIKQPWPIEANTVLSHLKLIHKHLVTHKSSTVNYSAMMVITMINTKIITIIVVLLMYYCHYYFISEVQTSNEASVRNKRGWQIKRSGFSPTLKSSALHPRPIGHSTSSITHWHSLMQ